MLRRGGDAESTVLCTVKPHVEISWRACTQSTVLPCRPRAVAPGTAHDVDDTGDVAALGRDKARRKGADLLVVNEVGPGRGFGTDDNVVTVLDARGETVAAAAGTKDAVADAVLDAVVPLLAPLAGD